MTVAEIITITLTVSSLVTALSILWAKFIQPVKKVMAQMEENTRQIKVLEEKIVKIKEDRAGDNAFSTEVRALLLESLIAVLDGLEQTGANHIVTEQKKRLISFMSRQV